MAEKVIKAEQIKKVKDGLDVWDDLHRYAAAGDYNAIDPDDLDRFKWYGIYRQKPNVGHFMVRIKIPGGALSAFKLREIGELARQYGRNIGDVTTRQDIQLHWLQLQDLPDLLDRIYNKLGMFQDFGCGDTPRNTTSCPLAGELADEIVDALPFTREVAEMFRAGGKEFSDLPRKYKTAITGCRSHCAAPQINCASAFGVERERNGRIERGFGLMVGGGLRDTPFFAQSLRVFLPPEMELIKNVFRAIAHIFRDCDELRQGRLRARLKFHVDRVGWRAFRDELEGRLGHPLEHDDSIVAPEGAEHDDHVGGGMLKNGLAFVGVPIPRGRLSGEQMIALADLADTYCEHPERQISATIKQNILLLNIPPAKVDDLKKELADLGLPTDAPRLRNNLLSCTGTQFCNLAVVETKDRAKAILDYLEGRGVLDEPLMISVTGCPNSCVQYQIADIGLTGTLFMYKGQKGVEHYHMLVGGRLGAQATFGRYICGKDDKKIKVPAELVHLSIERLMNAYRDERTEGQPFAEWADGQGMDRLAALIEPPAA